MYKTKNKSEPWEINKKFMLSENYKSKIQITEKLLEKKYGKVLKIIQQNVECKNLYFIFFLIGESPELKHSIILGDSAGGNIILGAMQLCIERGIRLPDGLFLAYVPLLVTMLPSPSRLLSLMDPLLPYGLMMRCAKGKVFFMF